MADLSSCIFRRFFKGNKGSVWADNSTIIAMKEVTGLCYNVSDARLSWTNTKFPKINIPILLAITL